MLLFLFLFCFFPQFLSYIFSLPFLSIVLSLDGLQMRSRKQRWKKIGKEILRSFVPGLSLKIMSLSFIHVVTCMKTSLLLHYLFLHHITHTCFLNEKTHYILCELLLLPPLANYFKCLLCTRKCSVLYILTHVILTTHEVEIIVIVIIQI